MQLYIKQIPTVKRPLLAGDHTNWSRPDAVTLQERTYEHSGTSIAGRVSRTDQIAEHISPSHS
ncbi:hypothetical protein FIS3754_03490 [Fischerella sp. NIES-3754]|jgi:hypothetical protein|nr:hypothetical protein FIS3754_03490 [Fischerella sp. NIES-3754]BAY95042.1 hypothetical protein NIES3275_70990 [Microchaete diplosiphon NIES-3275]